LGTTWEQNPGPEVALKGFDPYKGNRIIKDLAEACESRIEKLFYKSRVSPALHPHVEFNRYKQYNMASIELERLSRMGETALSRLRLQSWISISPPAIAQLDLAPSLLQQAAYRRSSREEVLLQCCFPIVLLDTPSAI
jgi:hypothetical protein